MKSLATIQVILCSTILLLTGCASRSTSTPELEQTININTFPSKLTIDDIGIEFTGYERSERYFTIQVCFDPPDEETWLLDDVVFKINNQEISNGEIVGKFGSDRTDGFGCGLIGYPIELIPATGKADLSIRQLTTFINRKSHRLEDCNRAQKKLDLTKAGVVISCDPAIVKLDSRFFMVTKKPLFMSDEDADTIVMDAFSENIRVNWIFSFFIDKP